jgi:predicted DNA-binding transcriptional regulator AlpA
MKPRRILRPKVTWAKLGCGKTKFEEDYRYHKPDVPFITGSTDIPRLKPIALGKRNIGFLEHEVDTLIDQLAAQRDQPATPPAIVRRAAPRKKDKCAPAPPTDGRPSVSKASAPRKSPPPAHDSGG